MVSAGSLIGEMAAILSEPRKKTLFAQGHVWALKFLYHLSRFYKKA